MRKKWKGSSKKCKDEFNEYYTYYIGDGNKLRKLKFILDVIYCYFRYSIWINNYFEYKFWEKSSTKRDEFLTWKRASKFINTVNGRLHNPVFREKHIFLSEFSDYISRDWLYVPDASEEQFFSFLLKHPVFIEKYDKGCFGKNVLKIQSNIISDKHQYYLQCKKNNLLLEECISECSVLQNLHSNSLNTIRVATLLKNDGSVEVLGAVLRIGNNGSTVDNARADGLFATIDVKTGIVVSKGINFMNQEYYVHPYSKEKIIGIQIPYWNEIINICQKVAIVQKETRFIGWDVVVREKNSSYYVELIEGNDRPGVPTLQAPLQRGLYKHVRKYM